MFNSILVQGDDTSDRIFDMSMERSANKSVVCHAPVNLFDSFLVPDSPARIRRKKEVQATPGTLDSSSLAEPLTASTPLKKGTVVVRMPYDLVLSEESQGEEADQNLGARKKLFQGKKGKSKKSKDEAIMTDNSDYEEGDEVAFTEMRRKTKGARYSMRLVIVVEPLQVEKLAGNVEFIEAFNQDLLNGKDRMHKYTRTLVKGDSWLSFKTVEYSKFFVDDLLAFKSTRLKTPGQPRSWIQSVPHTLVMGNKMTEMNKAFSKLVKYLMDKTREAMLASAADMQEGQKLKWHLDLLQAIKDDVEEKGYWAKAKAIVKEFKSTKQRHTSVLYPREAELIRDCIKNWNVSKVKKENLNKAFEIYETSAKGIEGDVMRVGTSDFAYFLQITLFSIQSLNCGRKSNLSKVTNRDVRGATAVHQSETGGEILAEGGEFSGKVIELLPLSSGASKTGQPVIVYLNQFCLDLYSMYKDLQVWYFVGEKLPRVSSRPLVMYSVNVTYYLSCKDKS